MTSKRALRFFLVSFFVLNGCGLKGHRALQQVTNTNYEFLMNGTLRVSSEDGSIHVYCWDHPGMHLQVTKRAYSPVNLASLQTKVSQQPGAISIEGIFPPRKKWSLGDRSGTLDYIMEIPWTARIENLELQNGEISIAGLRGGSARARLTNGRIDARNCFSPLDLRGSNAGIIFFYDWWEAGSFVARGTSDSGPVRLLIPPAASLHIEAASETGSVMGSLMEDRDRSGDSSINLDVGSSAGPTFKLFSKHGNVQIDHF